MSPTASRRPGRPPAAKADETRQRIMQAARLVFSERGYDGATFQAIAARADHEHRKIIARAVFSPQPPQLPRRLPADHWSTTEPIRTARN